MACVFASEIKAKDCASLPVPAVFDLDGSGLLGRWRSDVNTGSAEQPGSDVWAGPARIANAVRSGSGPSVRWSSSAGSTR